MQGQPTGFWGKLQLHPETREVLSWHPLDAHCADVGACCEALLQQTILRQRLARIGNLEDLDGAQVARLSLLATLHDLGKANLGFQNKSLPPTAQGRFTAGHVAEVMALLNDHDAEPRELLLASLPLDDLLAWSEGEEGALCLLLAAIAHHGKPVPLGGMVKPGCWKPARGLDPFAGIQSLVSRTRDWFPEAFEPGGANLPTAPAFQHAFSGVVMLADWLGSDSDRFFPYSEAAGDRMPFARRRASELLDWNGLAPGSSRRSLGVELPGFDRLSPYTPRAAQRVVLDLETPEGGSLTILEAETGAGKTEAALARYIRLFHRGQVDGMYFALPTRTAAVQLHRRVVEATRRAFPEEATPPVVLAVPGYVTVDDQVGRREDDEGRRLPPFEVLWPDDPRDLIRFRGWAAEHPKRYLAGSIVVGTIDQVLFSTLTVSHAHMRASSLLRLLLVVDEVHASDTYMTRLLESVLDYHLSAGGHSLLMSATLGTAAAHRLLETAGRMAAPAPGLEEACEVPFPAVTYRPRLGLRTTTAVPSDARTKEVEIELWPRMEDPRAIAERALDAAEAGARTLVLRNTVAACIETQKALERSAEARGLTHLLFRCRDQPAPHHSRYAAEDRRLLDASIEAAFGKQREQGGLVAVATQTVQQSLDLDADLLLTDLCPMDVLLQRVGRLHRHERSSRAAGFENPRVVVLMPEARDLSRWIRSDGKAPGTNGLGTVYSDLRVLEATWRMLNETDCLTIPTMNRSLVEMTTHPEALERLVEELGGAWIQHSHFVDGARYAESFLAGLNLLDRTVSFGEARFPDRAAQGKVQSRLGEDDRLAVLEPSAPGPFAEPVRTLKVPAFLAAGIPADATPEAEEIEEGELHIRWGKRTYRYDRLGLRSAEAGTDEEGALDA